MCIVPSFIVRSHLIILLVTLISVMNLTVDTYMLPRDCDQFAPCLSLLMDNYLKYERLLILERGQFHQEYLPRVRSLDNLFLSTWVSDGNARLKNRYEILM